MCIYWPHWLPSGLNLNYFKSSQHPFTLVVHYINSHHGQLSVSDFILSK